MRPEDPSLRPGEDGPIPPASGAMPAPPAADSTTREGSSFWLTRFVLLRLLGFVYLTAFLVAANQLVPLVGHEGLLPADIFLKRVVEHLGSKAAGFREIPTLFWWSVSDAWLSVVAVS